MLRHFLLTFVCLILLVMVGVMGFRTTKKPVPYNFPELKYFPKMPEADYLVSQEAVKLGRHLFYDPVLSLDSTLSCGSCHKQEAAFSDGPRQFSKGIKGNAMSRNTMPLFNLAWYPAFFWDGKAGSLEEQVFHPVRAHDEMGLSWEVAVNSIKKSGFYCRMFIDAYGSAYVDSVLIAKSIASFERTLISHNSKYDRVLRGEEYFTGSEYKGFQLLNEQTKGDCLHCHTSDADALGTTAGFSNNGLDSVFNPEGYNDIGKGGVTGNIQDYGLFRIPSLRNVAVTAPYMHDGRFKTLEEVIDFYSEGVKVCVNIDSKMGFAYRGGAHLSDSDKRDILAFLNTLTDSVFLVNPEFGNPFMEKND